MQDAIRDLSEWRVHLIAYARPIVSGETPVPHMPDHTNDLNGSSPHGWNPEMLSDYINSAESVLSKMLVDDSDGCTADSIVFINEAALKQRDAHHL